MTTDALLEKLAQWYCLEIRTPVRHLYGVDYEVEVMSVRSAGYPVKPDCYGGSSLNCILQDLYDTHQAKENPGNLAAPGASSNLD